MVMDPLSITTACITLLGAIGKTTQAVTHFVRTCREARGDLAAVSRELSDLRIVLDLFIEDSVTKASLPATFEKHVLALIENCLGVTTKVREVLEDHDGRTGPTRWAMGGKETVNQLRVILETHKGSLSLALELANLVSSKAIKDDTAVIRSDTVDIKEDTTNLLRQISDVTLQISKIRKAVVTSRRTNAAKSEAVDVWLESLTSYAESVCDDLMQELAPVRADTLLSEIECTADASTKENVAFENGGDLKVSKVYHFAYKNDIHFITMRGRYIVGVDGFSNIIIWDNCTGKQLNAFQSKRSHFWDIYKIKVGYMCGPDAEYVLLTQYRVGASVWDWKKGKCVLDVRNRNEDLTILHAACSEDAKWAIFWHHGNTIWKSKTEKWKKKPLVTIPGEAKIRQLGVKRDFIAALLEDGNAVLLDSHSGSIKATKTVCPPETISGTIANLSILQRQDGCRIVILIRDKPNGSITVIFWDVKNDTSVSYEVGGYEKKVTGRKAWDSHWYKEGEVIFVRHSSGLDLIDVATRRKRRYKTPFPQDKEVESVKDVRQGLFGQSLLRTVVNLGPQVSISTREGRRVIATRAPGGGVQTWDWDIEDNPFSQELEPIAVISDSMDGSTLNTS